MPESKTFYTDKLGLKLITDYRIDDNNWWVSLVIPGGGATITLARASVYPQTVRPETLSIYFETSDIVSSHNQINNSGVAVSEIQDDLFGPGSGVKFFNFRDPDGIIIHIVEEHGPGSPF